MRQQGAGRIINIASIVGLVPLRLQCAFVAAKAGVVNLTRAMALELGPHGILVNGIAPGSTLTEGTQQLFYGEDGKFRDNVQRMLDHVPLGRPGTTDEIAVAALFLADPENSYMNGHILTVDGGWTAGYPGIFEEDSRGRRSCSICQGLGQTTPTAAKALVYFPVASACHGIFIAGPIAGFYFARIVLAPLCNWIATLASVPGFVLAVCILRLCFWHCPRCHFLLFTKRDKFGNAFCYSCGLRVTYSNSGDTEDVG